MVSRTEVVRLAAWCGRQTVELLLMLVLQSSVAHVLLSE